MKYSKAKRNQHTGQKRSKLKNNKFLGFLIAEIGRYTRATKTIQAGVLTNRIEDLSKLVLNVAITNSLVRNDSVGLHLSISDLDEALRTRFAVEPTEAEMTKLKEIVLDYLYDRNLVATKPASIERVPARITSAGVDFEQSNFGSRHAATLVAGLIGIATGYWLKG